MRYSTLALAASLLAKDTVLAGPLHGHRVHHALQLRDITETIDYVETATVYTTVTVDFPIKSKSKTHEPTTTVESTTTVYISSTVKPATTSALPVSVEQVVASSSTPVAANAAAAVFKESKASTSTVAPTTFATSASPSPSATGSSSSGSSTSSGGKRGVPYNSASLVEAFLGSSVSWAYNWASSSDGLSSSIQYIPMLWGTGSSFTSNWDSNAAAAIANGATAILAFNEPDHAQQANMPASEAAAGYKQYIQPYAGKVKLGSPAVTNGAAPMGLDYLSNFISACDGCTIDFCNIHWYDSASNVDYFKQHMADAQTACGGKPIWITEFGATGSADEQAQFLDTVIPWLDSQDYIERYAYFMASDGVLLSGSSLSAIGEAFISA